MAELDAFEAAYRAYLTAVKQAWAEVDIDALTKSLESRGGNGCQGCGLGFATWGTAGTAGTVGTVGGTIGSAACVATFGSAGPGLTEQSVSMGSPLQCMGTGPPPGWPYLGHGGTTPPTQDKPYGGEQGGPT